MIAAHKRELSVAGAYVLILLGLGIFAPRFFQVQFHDTWIRTAPVLILGVGMTLVIVARQIDISIGSQFSVCAAVAGLLAKTGMPMGSVVACTVCTGAIMGAINGALIAGMGLPSIVVTLATMVIFRESLSWLRQGASVQDLPAGFQWFGQSQSNGQWILLIAAALIFLFFAWAMRWLGAGRWVYAVGSDQEAARLSGIRPARVVFAVFVLMGALTALAAILQAVRFAVVDSNSGYGLELQTIAAVVVGGTAISGGRGTLPGTFAGVALLTIVGAALGFLSGQAQWDKAIEGLILLSAVASDALHERRA
jgi:rhamnose transport system permease protein